LNKKYALVSIVLIALMSLSLIPAATLAWHTPCSTDDGLYEEFGPRPSLQLIKIYTDYVSELEGFKNKEVDVMDWALEPLDYQWFATNDPNHEQYATAFYTEFGAFQYDLNCQVLPTSEISVRRAFAHILDKQYFINTYLAGMAHKMDSALGDLPGWFNPAVTDLYNRQPRTIMLPLPDDPLDWEIAYDYLVADLGPPVPDPESPGFFTWIWPSPFPDWDTSGAFPPVADGHLLFFARSEMVPRQQQGQFFKTCVEDTLPAILVELGKPAAKLHVDLYIAPRATCRAQVFEQYRYHLYSGGWILNRDPDFLVYYKAVEIIKPSPNGNNYVMYANPDFDAEADLMLYSNTPGSNSNPCDGVYHAWAAQAIMENDEPVIWFWSTAGYKAYLANWRGMVNQAGFGMNSWWSFMNAHKIGSESCDLIRYGWQGPYLTLNVIGATWYWDYEVIGKVYDTLIAVNPYNVAEDRPWMASWEVGTWDNAGDTCSKVVFHLREDMWWQDVPYKDRTEYTLSGGHEIDGPFTNIQVTPVDVAFSMQYHRDNVDDWSQYLADPIDHVGLNPEWSAAWPWTDPLTDPPWWNLPGEYQHDFVQFDATLKHNDIVIYLGVFMPWLALHWVGGLYIIPMHIWMYIGIDGCELIDPWQADIEYGCGPWILLDNAPGISMTMIPFRNGQTYRGITLEKSGWMCYPVRMQSPPTAYTKWVGVTGKKIIAGVTTSMVSYDRMYKHDIEYYWTFDVTVEVNGTAYASTSVTTPTYTTPQIGFGTPYKLISGAKAVVLPVQFDWGIYADATITVVFTLHWHIASCEHGPTCNFISLWGHTCLIDPSEEDIMHVHPADIAGAPTNDPPYLGSDHQVSIKDATLIGLYWMQIVAPGEDAVTAKARADINGDNQVSIKDATLIGLFWMRTWP